MERAHSRLAIRGRRRCATLSCAHTFGTESETPHRFYTVAATTVRQLQRGMHLAEGHRRVRRSRFRFAFLPFVLFLSLSLPLSSKLSTLSRFISPPPRRRNVLRAGRMKVVKPRAAFCRDNHTLAGSFVLNPRAVECASTELRLAMAPVNPSQRNVLNASYGNFRIGVRERHIFPSFRRGSFNFDDVSRSGGCKEEEFRATLSRLVTCACQLFAETKFSCLI